LLVSQPLPDLRHLEQGSPLFAALQEMPRLAGFAGRALGRIATDLGLPLDNVDELVGLAAQLIGYH
jgi:hypothetical protein